MQQPPPFNKLKEGRNEVILDPDISIIDAHHHLFERPHLRYMIDDYLADVNAGHKIIASVYVETSAFARQEGPEELRPVGEVEFANNVAEIQSQGHGCKVAAGIVGNVDMTLGSRIAATLEGSMAAAPGRYRGVRQIGIAHPDPNALRFLTHQPPPDLLNSSGFRDAFRELGQRGLSFDATVLHHQLPSLAQLADEFAGTTVILDHAGLAYCGPASDRDAVFAEWRANMTRISQCPNVYCKVGGFGTSYWGFGFHERTDVIGYQEAALAWRPFVEAAIEAFGPSRCMVASNYPNDGRSCGFVPLWNALKSILKNYSPHEKNAIFSGTARKAYRLELM